MIWELRLVIPVALVSLPMLIALKIEAAEPTSSPWKRHIVDDSSRGADGVKLADIDGDGAIDITVGWEEGGVTRVYLNPGPVESKSRWPKVTVGKTPSVEDATFVDLDGDGHLDVVSCCEGEVRRIFVHWAPKGRRHLLVENKWEQSVLVDSQIHAQQWMFAWPMQVDGRNGVDLIAGSKGENAQIGWFEAPENGRDLSGYKWRPISQAGWIMSIWMRDMDGDQDLDLVISDRFGSQRGCRWLENPGYGSEQRNFWKSHAMGGGGNEVLSMQLADLDGDGLEDAVVAVKDMKILFLKRGDKTGLSWSSHEISADFNAGNTRAVVAADVNGDRHLDLVFTTWNADGKHGVVWMEHQLGAKQWKARQISGTSKGIKYDRIEMIDLDDDGDLDLLTCEEAEGGSGLGVLWYENPYGTRQLDDSADAPGH